jgi:hypothetical protein
MKTASDLEQSKPIHEPGEYIELMGSMVQQLHRTIIEDYRDKVEASTWGELRIEELVFDWSETIAACLKEATPHVMIILSNAPEKDCERAFEACIYPVMAAVEKFLKLLDALETVVFGAVSEEAALAKQGPFETFNDYLNPFFLTIHRMLRLEAKANGTSIEDELADLVARNPKGNERMQELLKEMDFMAAADKFFSEVIHEAIEMRSQEPEKPSAAIYPFTPGRGR